MTDQLSEQPQSLEQVETLSELLRIGKDEMNLAEFPMTSLSDRPIAGETSLKFEDQIFDDRKRKIIVRKRIIEGSKEYGLPTATDDSVILGLIQLTKLKNGFTSREVEFTRHELISLLNWPNKGQSYDRISLSLHRLAGVTYHFENSWWDNRRKAWTSKIFGIIDNVDLNDSRGTDGQGALFSSRIIWNQTVLDSFQAGYLRSIDFQLAMSFKHIISMRVYRFMGKRFHLQPEWTFDLKDFACEHIGLGRNYEGGVQLVRKLKPAIGELEDVGFLTPLPENERFTKKGRDWSIRLIQQSPALSRRRDAVRARGGNPPLGFRADQTRRARGDGGRAGAGSPGRSNPDQARSLRLADGEARQAGRQKPTGLSHRVHPKELPHPQRVCPESRAGGTGGSQTSGRPEIRRGTPPQTGAGLPATGPGSERPMPISSSSTRASGSHSKPRHWPPPARSQRESYESPDMARFRDTLMLTMLRDYVADQLEREHSPVEA